MILAPRITALLDACVLYPAPLRDLLLHLAAEGMYVPKWSDQIHDEWTRNLLINRPDIVAKQLKKTTEAMNGAFPDACVYRYEPLIESIRLPDADDRHVVAAAIRGHAHVIITANLKDFPEPYLRQFDLIVQHPDQFVLNLIESDPESVLTAFQNQVANLRNPPRTAEDVCLTLERTGLVATAAQLLDLL